MKYSAGLLMYRRNGGDVELLLAHPGGPIWASRDAGSWTIPKGEYEAPEEPLAAAQREFQEETGFVPRGPFLPLGTVVQPSRKRLTAFAFEGDCDPSALVSNTCIIEWPPRSGRSLEIPEIDRGQWFGIEVARLYIRPSQIAFLDHLQEALGH